MNTSEIVKTFITSFNLQVVIQNLGYIHCVSWNIFSRSKNLGQQIQLSKARGESKTSKKCFYHGCKRIAVPVHQKLCWGNSLAPEMLSSYAVTKNDRQEYRTFQMWFWLLRTTAVSGLQQYIVRESCLSSFSWQSMTRTFECHTECCHWQEYRAGIEGQSFQVFRDDGEDGLCPDIRRSWYRFFSSGRALREFGGPSWQRQHHYLVDLFERSSSWLLYGLMGLERLWCLGLSDTVSRSKRVLSKFRLPLFRGGWGNKKFGHSETAWLEKVHARRVDSFCVQFSKRTSTPPCTSISPRLQ